MTEGPAEAVVYHPATGKSLYQKVVVQDSRISGVTLPSFVDDIAVHIYR